MMVSRIALPFALAMFCGIAALTLAPHGQEAVSLLWAQDDPVRLADHALDRSFDSAVAAHEIQSALTASDPDLAQSFLDLAHDHHVPVDVSLAAQVQAANSAAGIATRAAAGFGRGLITGEPEDLAGLAGTAVGDLFVFGDIRDAMREGARLAMGQPADELILGFACVGLAVTAATYGTLGAGAPARVGLSLVKAARKTGRLTASMSDWLGRSLRDIVDLTALRRAIGSATLSQPALAVRAARQAVKVEKTREFSRLMGDVGRVQSKAGIRAALDGLKVAEGPRDISRIARLAEGKGSGTRAILKMFGRGAYLLTASAFNLFAWALGAVVTLLGFCAACKRAAERTTERYLAHRKARQARTARRFAAMTAPA